MGGKTDAVTVRFVPKLWACGHDHLLGGTLGTCHKEGHLGWVFMTGEEFVS